jgi:DNA-binding transcriptional MerR regulator
MPLASSMDSVDSLNFGNWEWLEVGSWTLGIDEGKDLLLPIGIFARRSRLSMKALRLYDKLGLLVPADVDPESGYRRYRESQLATARLIVMLRRLDMPLSQVAEIVSAPGTEAAARLSSYWTAFETRVASQRELAAHLCGRLSGREQPLAYPDITVRDVPEQLVLVEQQHVPVEELPAWIGATMSRLITAARDHGGVAGHPFVVYYGEVNEDSDGPAEACVPIAPASEEDSLPASAPTHALRFEPAHREAYIRVRKAQVAFPQLLSAYDGIVRWAAATNTEITGAPREIYFADFRSAASDDEVCDVAFPVR